MPTAVWRLVQEAGGGRVICVDAKHLASHRPPTVPPFVAKMLYTISSVLIGETNSFPVTLDETKSVNDLKVAIKATIGYSAPAYTMTLYFVNATGGDEQACIEVVKQKAEDLSILRPLSSFASLTTVFAPSYPLPESVHILVVPPTRESISSSACMADAVGSRSHADPSAPQGFEAYRGEDYLTALHEKFWGHPEKLSNIPSGTSIEFYSNKLTDASQQLYVFEQYAYLQQRIDAFRRGNTGKSKRSVIVTGTPGIGNAFYLLSPSDITPRKIYIPTLLPRPSALPEETCVLLYGRVALFLRRQ